ncbi:hypothetical protein GW17_00025930 [Ensete ventricosum]|nr:hypothetical protein GW17_00025930 [Ensete ventricosum]
MGGRRSPKERTQSEVTKALRCIGRGHIRRYHSLSSSHKNLNAMKMSPGGNMVQRSMVEQFEVIQHTREKSREGLDHTKEAKENRIDASPTIGCKGNAWELQSVFPSTKGNCSKNTEVLKQMVERGEEAMTSLEGLSYPKAKRQSEWRWTRRSAIVLQRRI